MAYIIKAPHAVPWGKTRSIFLAGTIDNGTSLDWQAAVEKQLMHRDVLLVNPRRDEWDSTWEQTIANPQFKQQVEWELEGLERADEIFMYFAPNSQSPITLLELGLQARTHKLSIVCDAGFWRRGNIEVLANKYEIPLFDCLENGIDHIANKLDAAIVNKVTQ